MIRTVVLAAGRGQRLGGPKALLAWQLDDGSVMPLAAVHAVRRLAAESHRVHVVARPRVAAALCPWLPAGADAVSSSAPEALGPAGSIAAAVMAAMPAGDRGGASAPEHESSDSIVIVTPVDCVPASSDTVQRLVDALRKQEGALVARPRHGGRGGHPVALRSLVLERYRGPAPPPLRELIRRLGSGVVDVAVEDPGVLADIDTPYDLAACGQGPARFFPAAAASDGAA